MPVLPDHQYDHVQSALHFGGLVATLEIADGLGISMYQPQPVHGNY